MFSIPDDTDKAICQLLFQHHGQQPALIRTHSSTRGAVYVTKFLCLGMCHFRYYSQIFFNVDQTQGF